MPVASTPASVRDYATLYIEKGWQVVPLAPGTKECCNTGWMRLVFKPEDFRADDNIGIRSVNGLVDIDLDAPEAVELGEAFLTPTGARYGRHGQPRHWLYRSEFPKQLYFKDLGAGDGVKAMLVEVRVGHQSMAPPSVHPNGGRVEWVAAECGSPATVEPDVLHREVKLLATCILLCRYYNPSGNRHDWGLHVSGALRRFGLSEEETLKVFTHAANRLGDGDPKNRLEAVRSTYARPESAPTSGLPSLRKVMPKEKGDSFAASLRAIWGDDDFARDEKWNIVPSRENIRRGLQKLSVRLWFDEFNQRHMLDGRPLDDSSLNQLWFAFDEKLQFRPHLDFFTRALQTIAEDSPVHPVREYLDSRQWDGTERVDSWLTRHGKAADTDYVRAVAGLVLIAAVRRARRPGCKFDEMLVLESGQGQLKSSVLRALCPEDAWFSDDLPLNVDAKQIIERTAGKWIIEAADLSGMRKSQVEQLKAMLSRQVDGPVRMAYGRLPVERPRQFIIVGTTNDHHYLQDATGNRRFWPVRVQQFDVDAIRRERDQLWAEAAHREAAGESIRLDASLYTVATKQQNRRRIDDPWEEKLRVQFGGEDYCRVPPEDLWMTIGVPVERRDDKAQRRVSTVMQSLGFRRMSVRDQKGRTVWGWGRGAKEQGLVDEEHQNDDGV